MPTFSVLRATVGTLRKTWEPGPPGEPARCRGYDRAYWHTFFSMTPLPGAEGMLAALSVLASDPSACVIRGNPNATTQKQITRDPRAPLRRIKDNFSDAPGADWLCFDVDEDLGVPFPPYEDPQRYAADARLRFLNGCQGELRTALANAMMLAQLSASCGMKTGKTGVHFWVPLDAPVSCETARAVYELAGSDPALAGEVQPHYTAAPAFVGLPDPLPNRVFDVGTTHALRAAALREIVAPVVIRRAKERQLEERLRAQAKAQASIESDSSNAPHASALQVAALFRIITDPYGPNGDALCDCPRHASSSRTSLRIDSSGEQWYCFGCQQGGGAWALAEWCLPEGKRDRASVIESLRAARAVHV